jgi:opacity protein-like surface antigen
MRRGSVALFVLVAFGVLATPAFADITGFFGVNTTPANRTARGVAVGAGMLVIGFEFEYAATSEDVKAGAPSLKTGMGNLLLQTPAAILGIQPYLTAGGGFFRETLADHRETNLGLNTGAGAKINLAGPLRLRIDYRVFKLSGGALHSPAHRVYVGLNLKF